MILKYGPYAHANNEVAYTITRDALRTQGGTFYAYRERWQCKGDLLNLSSQAAITNAINALTAAYSQDGLDLVHYLDDGVTPTAHALISANCNGGTRIVQAPSFPDTHGGGEYQPSFGRSYTFSVEGEVALTGTNVVLKFTEKLSFKGTGGPVKVWIPVAQGPWVRQITAQSSTFKVTQSGHAIGLYAAPPVPPPIWPDALIEQEVTTDQESPQRFGLYEWPVSWSYTFESSGGLSGSASASAG